MKVLSKLLIIILIMILSFGFGCNKTTYDKTYFNTNVYIETRDKKISDETEKQIDLILNNTENQVSLNKNGSFCDIFNKAEKGESVYLPYYAKEILSSSILYNKATDGKFNPAILPLLNSWQLSSTTYSPTKIYVDIPSSEEIEKGVNLSKMFSSLSIENDSVIKPENGFLLDFGGIAKGFAVDKISSLLKAEGHSEGYISIGGSSIYIFSTEEDLSVAHPRKTKDMPYILTVSSSVTCDKCLSTSGDYFRYYPDENGKYYSHVIDGETGYPADTGIISLTVIGRTATECDALSTALMTFSKTAFIEYVKNNLTDCSVFAVFCKDSEKQIITNEKQGNFTLLDDSYSIYSI